jgi:hypothetical protein
MRCAEKIVFVFCSCLEAREDVIFNIFFLEVKNVKL